MKALQPLVQGARARQFAFELCASLCHGRRFSRGRRDTQRQPRLFFERDRLAEEASGGELQRVGLPGEPGRSVQFCPRQASWHSIEISDQGIGRGPQGRNRLARRRGGRIGAAQPLIDEARIVTCQVLRELDVTRCNGVERDWRRWRCARSRGRRNGGCDRKPEIRPSHALHYPRMGMSPDGC